MADKKKKKRVSEKRSSDRGTIRSLMNRAWKKKFKRRIDLSQGLVIPRKGCKWYFGRLNLWRKEGNDGKERESVERVKRFSVAGEFCVEIYTRRRCNDCGVSIARRAIYLFIGRSFIGCPLGERDWCDKNAACVRDDLSDDAVLLPALFVRGWRSKVGQRLVVFDKYGFVDPGDRILQRNIVFVIY